MTQLKYVEVGQGGNTYSIFPFTCTTNTSIVIKDLYIPLQNKRDGGVNLFSEGPGRFQSSGDCFACDAPTVEYPSITFGFSNWNWSTETVYYKVSYGVQNAIDGKVEFGNGYLKINDSIVATGTPYTGQEIVLTQPFYLFNHFHIGWNNWVRAGARCGQVKFYQNGTLSATYTPMLDDNNRAGFWDENNQAMIYSEYVDWVAGPEGGAIDADASSTIIKSTGDTITINVRCENSWTVSQTDNWLTLSSTGDTGTTAITATAPNYSGSTDRTTTLTFTDSVEGETAELTIKQKRYVDGQPFYLGANEISEIYLGANEITEAYLGDVLVFSSGSAPAPTPSANTTITFSSIMQVGANDEQAAFYVEPDILGVSYTYDGQNDECVGTVDSIATGFTASIDEDNSTVQVTGPFQTGVTYTARVQHSDSMTPCGYDDATSLFTVTASTMSIQMSSPEPTVDPECECLNQGGVWEGGECIYPEPIEIDPI